MHIDKRVQNFRRNCRGDGGDGGEHGRKKKEALTGTGQATRPRRVRAKLEIGPDLRLI